MASRRIYITQEDARRLNELLIRQRSSNNKDRENLRVLAFELSRATLIAPDRVMPDVVTMNSRVLVEDPADGQTEELTLVFPEEADAAEGRISVVAPIGAALLGCRTDETVEFAVPRGTRTLRVRQILFQPEASGLRL